MLVFFSILYIKFCICSKLALRTLIRCRIGDVWSASILFDLVSHVTVLVLVVNFTYYYVCPFYRSHLVCSVSIQRNQRRRWSMPRGRSMISVYTVWPDIWWDPTRIFGKFELLLCMYRFKISYSKFSMWLKQAMNTSIRCSIGDVRSASILFDLVLHVTLLIHMVNLTLLLC